MTLVTLSSTDTAGIIADALGEKPPEKVEKPPEVKEAPKVETKAEETEDGEVDFATELGITKEQQERFQKILQREVGKKHRRAKEAEEFAEAQFRERLMYEGRVSELEERLKSVQPAAKKEPEGEPTRDQFKTDEEYGSALLDYRVDQRLKERERLAAEQRQQEMAQTAASRIAKALEIVPDFREVTEAADFIVPANVATMMQESPMFAELGYHFAKSPDELGKLAILSPERAKVAFKEIEARMAPFSVVKTEKAPSGSQPATPQASTTDAVPSKPRAPEPITPLSTASGGQVVKSPENMNVRDHIAAFQKEKGVSLTMRKRH